MDKKKNFSTFSYKLVQISPIMILVNSGAFLSISSWFCELTELSFVIIPYISSNGYPPKTQGIMGHVQSSELQEISNGPIQFKAEVIAKFSLCSDSSQELDECSLLVLTKFLQLLACSDARIL